VGAKRLRSSPKYPWSDVCSETDALVHEERRRTAFVHGGTEVFAECGGCCCLVENGRTKIICATLSRRFVLWQKENRTMAADKVIRNRGRCVLGDGELKQGCAFYNAF
jgi:hypothetical protein